MHSIRRLSTSLLFALSFALSVSAAPRTKAAIKAAAAQVLGQVAGQRKTPAPRGTLKPLQANRAYTIVGYEQGGFAIIANDDLVPAVVGYSGSTFSKTTENENFRWYLAAAEAAINDIVERGVPHKTPKPDPGKYAPQVPALITSHWGQEKPYNDLCPEGTESGIGGWQGYGSTGKTVTGCVATAMAQIMRYNGYPRQGTGTHSVYVKQADRSYKTVTVDYAESIYDWDNMIDDYNGDYTPEQAAAVARLMLDCGVAADMQYATDGSGTYTENACEGLKRNLGYPETTRMLERDAYGEAEWMDIIYNELNEQRAIFYTGVTPGNEGHAFVLCGYDAEGKVWINWGWEGDSDGFYDIALLNPRSYSFSNYQDMIVGFGSVNQELLTDTVDIDVPGTLADLIPDSVRNRISELKVSGRINSTDLRLIRRIAGRDAEGKSLPSALSHLDLEDAEIVEGGEPYLTDGTKRLTTAYHEIPERAFYGCRTIRTLCLPKTTTAIADGSFGRMSRLDSLAIPTGEDKSYVLDGTMILTKDSSEIIAVLPYATGTLSIRNGIRKIHDYGLAGCSRLTTVVLPGTITRIGDEAFAGNGMLAAIRLHAKQVPGLGRSVFADLDKATVRLYVPAGTKDLYERSGQWKDFASKADNIIEFGTILKARSAIRAYGEQNPDFGWQLKGDYVSGTPQLSCEATPSSPVGQYAIHIARGSVTEEQVEFVDGVLHVKKATANLRADSQTIGAGETPAFTYTVDSLQNNEQTVLLTEAPAFTVKDGTGATVTSFDTPGQYTIYVSGGLADNYQFNYFPGRLTIKPAADGIADVRQDEADETAYVYRPDGTRAGKGKASLGSLPKGVYIVNGKKIVVR